MSWLGLARCLLKPAFGDKALAGELYCPGSCNSKRNPFFCYFAFLTSWRLVFFGCSAFCLFGFSASAARHFSPVASFPALPLPRALRFGFRVLVLGTCPRLFQFTACLALVPLLCLPVFGMLVAHSVYAFALPRLYYGRFFFLLGEGFFLCSQARGPQRGLLKWNC